MSNFWLWKQVYFLVTLFTLLHQSWSIHLQNVDIHKSFDVRRLVIIVKDQYSHLVFQHSCTRVLKEKKTVLVQLCAFRICLTKGFLRLDVSIPECLIFRVTKQLYAPAPKIDKQNKSRLTRILISLQPKNQITCTICDWYPDYFC